VASGIAEPRSPEDSEGEKQREQGSGIARHSKLVERLLSSTASLPNFINDLLATQAVVVAGTEAAAFIVERGQSGASLKSLAHIRPDNSNAQQRAAALAAFQEIVTACVNQAKDGAIEISTAETGPEPQFCLVTLLRHEGNIIAVSAVITRCRNADRAKQRLVSMQLVAGYFELYNLRRASEQSQIVAQSHQHVLQLATAVATAHGFEAAGMSLCNELAARTGAARVSLGWMKGTDVKVRAFSHTEEFDKKQELVVELQKVMEECVDQEEPVHYVPAGGGTGNVTRAAANFSRMQGGNSVLALPLRRQDEIEGVVVLEFAPTIELTQQALTSLSVAVDLLAPQLYDRHANDRWLITKAGISIRDMAKLVIGPQHMLAKTITALVIAVLLFVCLFPMEYHVRAPFQFAPVAKSTISCPTDGYIESVFVRPGAHVHAGDALLKFKTVELEKRLHESTAQRDRAVADAKKAQSDSQMDRSKMGDYEAHMAEARDADAYVQLYQLEIDEATIKAPTDGLVLTGDLEDQVNSFKKQGDELFTFQSTDRLRAELFVAENDIQEVISLGVKNGGQLATTSLPREKYPFTIERVDPQGQPKEGANIFKVDAYLPESGQHPEWRPGMEGEARINIEPRTIGWIWTHKFIDWLRLKSWTLL